MRPDSDSDVEYPEDNEYNGPSDDHQWFREGMNAWEAERDEAEIRVLRKRLARLHAQEDAEDAAR
jgi:hypothetical protein